MAKHLAAHAHAARQPHTGSHSDLSNVEEADTEYMQQADLQRPLTLQDLFHLEQRIRTPSPELAAFTDNTRNETVQPRQSAERMRFDARQKNIGPGRQQPQTGNSGRQPPPAGNQRFARRPDDRPARPPQPRVPSGAEVVMRLTDKPAHKWEELDEKARELIKSKTCLLYTSDAADE